MGRSSKSDTRDKRRTKKVRYAVVGLGHIAQAAVLPAFKNARSNSELTALVSDDPRKLEVLSRKYAVERTYGYDDYDKCLRSGEVDAVYIALPNDLHRDYTIRAAEAGVHVLCEKPLAPTVKDCNAMIEACESAGVRLMTAYRLHYEGATLDAIEAVQSGSLGEPRFFNSTFSMQVARENIRIEEERAGGPLLDLGIYCINAARNLFRAEPEKVFALHAFGADPRFQEVPEMTSALMWFPRNLHAAFTCSFGAIDTSVYRVVCTQGEIEVEPAYDYSVGLNVSVTRNDKTKRRGYAKRDQFAPELLDFSRCILEGKEPEPSGEEGLADIRVIEAMNESAATGKTVELERFERSRRPTIENEIHCPPIKKPEIIRAQPAHAR